MSGLAEFLKARLNEDEATAQANIGDGGLGDDDAYGPGWPDYATYTAEDSASIASAEAFLDRFRPLRQLREVAAKRHMLNDLDLSYPDEEYLLRLLASAYSDHPDYDQAWALPPSNTGQQWAPTAREQVDRVLPRSE